MQPPHLHEHPEVALGENEHLYVVDSGISSSHSLTTSHCIGSAGYFFKETLPQTPDEHRGPVTATKQVMAALTVNDSASVSAQKIAEQALALLLESPTGEKD